MDNSQSQPTNKNLSMIIDGLVSVESPDKSAETLSIEGADISSLVGGSLNREHADTKEFGFSSVVGKCIYAVKLIKRTDCSNDRELSFWDKWELPCIYAKFRLFNDHEESLAAQSIIRDSFINNESLPGLSIEGKTIKQEGSILKSTIARDVALTFKPANAACITGVLEDPVIGYKYQEVEEEELGKSLEAGNCNSAPGTLTQGAALQRESIGNKVAKVKVPKGWKDIYKKLSVKYGVQKALEAVMEASSTQKSELKVESVVSNLPTVEASPLLLKFESDIVEFKQVVLDLGRLIKAEKDSSPVITMRDNPEIKYKVLGEDPNFYYLKHYKDEGIPGNITKVRRFAIDQFFDTSNLPKNHTETSTDDAVTKFTHSANQLSLLNGINLTSKTKPPEHYREGVNSNYPDKPFWTKNKNKQAVYIKNNISDIPNQAEHEGIYNLFGHKYFGLGEHLPVVSVFKHPITGVNTLAVEGIPNVSHLRKYHDDEKNTDAPVLDHCDCLAHNGSNGNLDRLFLADWLLGKQDRSRMNMLFNNKDTSKLHIIDNSNLFTPTKELTQTGIYPKYSMYYDRVNPAFNKETLPWFQGLNLPSMIADLGKMGVSHDQIAGVMSRYAQAAKALSDPQGSRSKLWHGGYT